MSAARSPRRRERGAPRAFIKRPPDAIPASRIRSAALRRSQGKAWQPCSVGPARLVYPLVARGDGRCRWPDCPVHPHMICSPGAVCQLQRVRPSAGRLRVEFVLVPPTTCERESCSAGAGVSLRKSAGDIGLRRRIRSRRARWRAVLSSRTCVHRQREKEQCALHGTLCERPRGVTLSSTRDFLFPGRKNFRTKGSRTRTIHTTDKAQTTAS